MADSDDTGDVVDTKKQRTPNFGSAERLHLMEIISRKYVKVLENKKTDRVSVEERNTVWEKVEDDFNGSSNWGIYRDKDSLKRLYENRKREVRRLKAKESQLRMKTGGGPEIVIKLDPADELLLSIINKKTVQGFQNPHNCDSESKSMNVILETPAKRSAEFIVEKGEMHCQVNREEEDEEDTTAQYKWQAVDCLVEPQEKQYESGSFVDKEQSSCSTYKITDSAERPTWKKGNDLQKPKDPALLPPHLRETKGRKVVKTCITRQPRRHGVTILSSSNIAKKYDAILDRRGVLIEKQIEQVNQDLHFQKIKNKLEVELLTLKVEKEKTSQ